MDIHQVGEMEARGCWIQDERGLWTWMLSTIKSGTRVWSYLGLRVAHCLVESQQARSAIAPSAPSPAPAHPGRTQWEVRVQSSTYRWLEGPS